MKPFLTNCFISARDTEDHALFDTDGYCYLDRYAIIPMEVFEAMGGIGHPAIQEVFAEDRKRVAAIKILPSARN